MELHLAHRMSNLVVLHELLPHKSRPQILRHQHADSLVDPENVLRNTSLSSG